MTRFRTAEDLQRLLDGRVAESVSLEYKRELDLGGQRQRLEALKDLTGMANGGGGTVLYGIAERSGADPVPEVLHPLTDPKLVGVLEDIVRSGVRPPLYMEPTVIEVDGGVVLAVDVEPSPLGPYMVESYGDARYYHRSVTRTGPMSEQQVRDAYALAARSREHRAQLWSDRGLPMAAGSAAPWLTVSALPEEPLAEILDLTSVEPDALVPPQPIAGHLESSVGLALQRLGRWAQGYYGDRASDDRPASESVRIHRDGAAAIGAELYTELSIVYVARQLNGVLAYLAWLWTQFELRRPVEIEIRLHNLRDVTFEAGSVFGEVRRVREPPGVPVHHVTTREHRRVSDLRRAGARHRVVRQFADGLYQAFGLASCQPLFRSGQLYGRDGRPLQLSIAGSGVWSGHATAEAIVYDDGSIRRVRSGDEVVGHIAEGVIVDAAGDTLAVVEMAPGAGCPDDFLPSSLLDDPRARVPGGNPGRPHSAAVVHPAPVPTGRWSGQDLLPLLRP